MSDGTNGLPPGWARLPLRELAEVRLGRQRSPDRANGPNMRKYVRAANVTWAGVSTDDVKEMDFRPAEFELFRLEKGDLLIVEGSGSATEVGKPAVWNGDIEDCCFQNTLIRVRAHPHLVAFLHEHFRKDAITGNFARSSRGIGIHHIGQKALEDWAVDLAPLNEQKRIVAKLNALQARSDAAKGALDAIPPLLEKFRQSVLAAAFRGDLTRKWREAHPDVEPASELLARIRAERRLMWEQANPKRKYVAPKPVDAEGLPELPEGWCWAAAEELTAPGRPIIYGIIKAGDHHLGGVPVVRVTDITSGRLDLATIKRCHPDRAEKFSRAKLKTGDIVVSKDGTIGRIAFVPPEFEGANISQHVLRYSPSPHIDRLYLALMIQAPGSQAWMKGETRGVALQGVNVEDFRMMPIPVPPDREQVALTLAVGRRFELLSVVEQVSGQREALASLNQSILAKAFRGELVPQDPADESASVLLERIRAERAAGKRGRGRRGAAAAGDAQD